MREYVEPIYGWDPDRQRKYLAEWFDADRISIVEGDEGAPIGVVDVSDESDYLYLSRIEILPEAQGRGFGSAVVRELISRGRTVRLHVFTNNVRARAFFEGLGFRVDRHSEREHHLSMHHPSEAVEEP
jgi:ribosomal protein S18 acetylase RimI-like enzyme